MRCSCVRPLTLGWIPGGTSTLDCDACSSDLAAFYLAAHFHHLELFSIQSHRQPDYRPLRSVKLIWSYHCRPCKQQTNSQADTCSRARGMLSPAHLTLSRPLPSPTAYKTAGLLGLMSLWMTKHMGSSHKICHVSLPANLTFLSYCILFDNLNSLRVFY